MAATSSENRTLIINIECESSTFPAVVQKGIDSVHITISNVFGSTASGLERLLRILPEVLQYLRITLKINPQKISRDEMDEVWWALLQCPRITLFDFNGATFDDVTGLVDTLYTNRATLTAVDLSDCKFKDEHFSHLFGVLAEITNLSQLSLCGIDLSIESRTRHLSRVLCYNDNLDRLSLERCLMKSRDAVHLAKIIAGAPNLLELDLRHNFLKGAGCGFLAKSIREHRSLVLLRVDHNDIETEGGVLLLKAVKNHPTLSVLGMSSNALGIGVSKHMQSVLRNNRTLTDLDISCNRLGNKGVAIVMKGLIVNSTLTSIHAGGNNRPGETDGEGFDLLELMRYNTTLDKVSVGIAQWLRGRGTIYADDM